MTTFRFASPYAGIALLIVLALVVWRLVGGRGGRASLVFSLTAPFRLMPPGLAVRLRHVPAALRVLGLALLIVALARPQTGRHEEEVLTEGIDIVLAVDISGSMRTEDFKPKNRLVVARDVVAQFVRARRNDLMGLVVFAERLHALPPHAGLR